MNESDAFSTFHRHVFLGEGHEKSERKTWAVIWLCGAMMIAEIVGGLLFGSIALVKPARSPSLPVPKVKFGSSACLRA